MKYAIKQKLFSLADSFTITDENGRAAYVVKGQLLSFGKKLRMFDTAENELCYIEQKIFRLLPEYDIYIAGDLYANVKKRFALFRNDFDVTSKVGNYEVVGDFLAYEFTIVKSGSEVARISKKFFALTDTYGVEISQGEEAVALLALAIVIDMVCHDKHGGH